LVGNIISRFEQKGYKLVALKTKQATAELLQAHYKDLVDKVCGYGLRFGSLSSLFISTPLTHSAFQTTILYVTHPSILPSTTAFLP
jgi:nucleoside diphosphate kinase